MSFYLTVCVKNDNFFQCFSCLIENNQFLNWKIKIIRPRYGRTLGTQNYVTLAVSFIFWKCLWIWKSNQKFFFLNSIHKNDTVLRYLKFCYLEKRIMIVPCGALLKICGLLNQEFLFKKRKWNTRDDQLISTVSTPGGKTMQHIHNHLPGNHTEDCINICLQEVLE